MLAGKAFALEKKFNFATNARAHWPLLRNSWGNIGKLIHFLDSPKPWGFFGKWIHAQTRLWHEVANRTAIAKWRQPADLRRQELRMIRRQLPKYKQTLKDRVLFYGYSIGWLKRVKGVPA